MKNRMKKASLCMAIGTAMALAASLPALAHGSAPGWAATATHAVQLAPGAVNHGPAAPDTPLRISVVLKVNNKDLLHQVLASRANPRSAITMSAQDVVDVFSPSDDEVQAVVDYLDDAGFTNIHVSSNRLVISADGNAAAAAAAFNTRLASVTTAHGRSAYANTDDVHVPAGLAGSVLSVLGLQTVHHAHTMGNGHGGGHGGGGGGSTGGVVTGHYPQEFQAIYNVGSTPTASSVTVGIISDGDMTQPLIDLHTFTSSHGLPDVNTAVVYPGARGSDTSGTAEWDLDSQNIVGMSGGVAKLIFYAATSLTNSDLTQAFNKVVSDNQAQVINVSLGECETYAYQDGSMAADDQILALAVAQGQTFSISTGDSGSNECGKGGPHATTPSYPASSPYVIAVSGTTLSTDSSGNWYGETLWADAGGSPSTVEPKPDWQTLGDNHRDVADVAFDADPYSGSIIVVNGGLAQYGGTSLSAPLFAATWARMLAAHPGLGFAGPYLYNVSTGVYHDITSGSNGGETATAGWDYASGFGSIDVSALNASL
ncbi:MAG TPA: S53 family peptidase [Rhodanobacteraceae bacterium]|nr:S53 family peptidase [Rhodanobacteraceae bacterium]